MKKIKQRSILFDIVIKIISIITLAILGIIFFNSYENKKLAYEIVKDITNKQNEFAVRSVNDYLASYSTLCFNEDAIDHLIRNAEDASLNDPSKIEKIIRIFNKHPHLKFIQVTNTDTKHCIKIYSHKNTKTIEGIPHDTSYVITQFDGNNSKIYFINHDLKVITQRDPLKDGFAIKEDGAKPWSNAYVFDDTLVAQHSAERQLSGHTYKVSHGINLKKLSIELNEARLTDQAHLFVIDGDNRIVGDSDINDETNLKTADELGIEQLSKALELHKNQDANQKLDRINFFKIKGEAFYSLISDVPHEHQLDWRIASTISTADYIENFYTIEKTNLLVTLLILSMVISFYYFQIQKLSNPITYLAIETDKIKELELDDPVKINSHLGEINTLSHSLQQLKTSVTNFSKYIPKSLVKKFVDGGQVVGIGGQLTNITIMFSDIQNFTSIAEKIPAEELMQQLSNYFDHLSGVILDNNGTIDKFIGDAIMAFWGAPDQDKNQIINACRAALMCQQKLAVLNNYWQNTQQHPLYTRIGIHQGDVVVGNVGSSERLNYTALGDNVNIAARLEGINKLYGTRILISENVKSQLPKSFIFYPVDIVAVKGREQGIKIYELIGLENDSHLNPIDGDARAFVNDFTKAFDLYLSQQWADALILFKKIKTSPEHNPCFRDSLVDIYITRCDELIKNPPSKNWDGVIHLASK
jgi:adenylate cyclase